MIDIKLQKGTILIAEPSILNDNSFNRSVILLTEHNKDGSLGFILNKPSKFTINDLIPEIKSNHTIYDGGPVSVENLYFIHSVPHLIPNSLPINNDVFWAGDFDVLKSLLEENEISENELRFFLGYTGWDSNQLLSEMKDESSWILKKNDYPNILNVSPKSFWKDEMMKSGGEYQIWANAPENPNLN